MKNRSIWVLLILLAGFVGYLLYQFIYDSYPKHNWELTLRPKGGEPYDLDIFYEMLENMKGVSTKINKGKPLRSIEMEREYQAYCFISQAQPQYTQKDINRLMDFLQAGGKALFICPSLGDKLSTALLKPEAKELILLEVVNSEPYETVERTLRLGFFKDSPQKTDPTFYLKGPDTLNALYFQYFRMNPEWFYLNQPVKQLGYIGNKINFLEIPVGKGSILWHSNLPAFANFHLLRPEMQVYADRVVSQLKLTKSITTTAAKESTSWMGEGLASIFDSEDEPDGKKVLIDEASKLPIWSEEDLEKNSPLRYILSQKAFQWAWYVLLFAVGLYLLLLARRRQRIIPLLPSRTNSILHFIQAISDLYLRQESHYFMCQQKMKLFLNHIRTRYGIGNQPMSVEQINLLARRSGTDPELVTSIFQEWNYIQDYSMQDTTARQLVHFHRITEQFYHQSK